MLLFKPREASKARKKDVEGELAGLVDDICCLDWVLIRGAGVIVMPFGNVGLLLPIAASDLVLDSFGFDTGVLLLDIEKIVFLTAVDTLSGCASFTGCGFACSCG